MPWHLSSSAQSLLRGLFKRNPVTRLGSGPGGAQDLRQHCFFAAIDWDKLYNRQMEPPFLPLPPSAVSDHAHYFDAEFTQKTPRGEC